jgi:pimeloyl-ACP methyl ester carboxylesterase
MQLHVEQREIVTNGLRFAYLEAGEGPLVVLLHGFPDNAHTWENQVPALVRAGYRVVAPWLRGYPPTEVPAGGYYDRGTLVRDVRCLVDALGDGKPCRLVGHDWGAAIAYGALGAYPELFERAVILAIPHPVQIRRLLGPRQAIRAFHWFLFQLPVLPEALVRAWDYKFLEFLWWLWSAERVDDAHMQRVKRMMEQPGAVEATLGYYRAMWQKSRRDPELRELRRLLDRPIPVPTLVLCGKADMRGEMLEQQRDLFTGPYEWATIDGAGHFLQRERPEETNQRMLEWLRR